MERSWLMHELSSLKPYWLSDIKLFSVKNSKIVSFSNFSRIFSVIGSNDIDW